MPLQNQEQRLAPKLQQKSIYTIPDGMRGFLGASLLQETVIENQKLRQQHRKIEHDFYEQELPLAVTREKEIAAEAVKTKVEIMNRFHQKPEQLQKQQQQQLPELKSVHEDEDDLSFMLRSASPIQGNNNKNNNKNSKTTDLINDTAASSVVAVAAAAKIMAVKNEKNVMMRSASSLSSPPRHLHSLSQSYPRLSPFTSMKSQDNQNRQQGRNLSNNNNSVKSSTSNTFGTMLLSKNNTNTSSSSYHTKNRSTTSQNKKPAATVTGIASNSVPTSLSNANDEKEDSSDASSLLYRAAGVSKGASNALVRQLELLRLRTPTPAMVDDVRAAFQKYNGAASSDTSSSTSPSSQLISDVSKAPNQKSIQQHLQLPPRSHSSLSIASIPSADSFQFTRCVVVSNAPLVGESVLEHHTSQSRNRERRFVPAMLLTSSSSSNISTQNSFSQQRNIINRSQNQQQSSDSKQKQTEEEPLPSSLLTHTTSETSAFVMNNNNISTTATTIPIYSTHEKRMDAIDDNGELCGRLRHDISSIPRSRNNDDKIRIGLHVASTTLSSLSLFKNLHQQNAMPLKFVQF